MKNNTINQTEPIIIADECGDTLWDAVLQQEVNACEIKPVPANTDSLLKNTQTDLSVNSELK